MAGFSWKQLNNQVQESLSEWRVKFEDISLFRLNYIIQSNLQIPFLWGMHWCQLFNSYNESYW